MNEKKIPLRLPETCSIKGRSRYQAFVFILKDVFFSFYFGASFSKQIIHLNKKKAKYAFSFSILMLMMMTRQLHQCIYVIIHEDLDRSVQEM